jgi:hypothetical protein
MADFMRRRLEPRPVAAMFVLLEAHLPSDARRAVLTEPELLARRGLACAPGIDRYQPQVRSPACSADAMDTADRRAIGGQSVRLSANPLRPERRSTDGQTILTAGTAD